MEATLNQAALPAPTSEQDQLDPTAFIGNITSRISVQKVCSIVRKFDKFKRTLVEDIGFGGMLKIQMLTRLNLKFSAWLMERVESGKLKIDEERILQIQDHDVEKVFDLPRGNRWICSDTPEPSEACLEFLRASDSLSKGAHSLKAAEAYLLRDDINEDSSKVQIDCFKIAFVIFVIGHLLAPSTKNDYISIDFWAALNDTSQIKEFNWCRYVLEHLIRAVRKLKSDIHNRHKTINLAGCHIFLQVFYLDNLDLGPFSYTQEDLPRISLFDSESMKKMTNMITNDVGGDTSFAGATFRCAQDVCYSRVQHVSHTEEPFTLETNQAENRTGEAFTLDTNRADSHTEDPFTLETNRRDIAFDLPRNSPGFVGTEDQSSPNNIFDLDNLDLGPLSMTLEDLQRIGLFDCESIKNMPDMITNDVAGGTSFAGANLRSARDVCYSSVQYESHTEEPFTPETNRADIASDLPRHSPGFVGTEDQHSPTDPMLRSSFIKTGPEEFSNHLQSKYPSLVGNPLATILEEHNANIIPDQHSPIIPMLRSSFTEAGPEDFSNYLRSKYPSLVDHPIVTILEEHNARVMENITELIDSYQVTMFSFEEELLRSISEKRCCCKASGRTDCLLRSPNATHGNARRTTPKRKSRFCPTETGHHKKTRDMPDGQR